jgi:hypothetical protein
MKINFLNTKVAEVIKTHKDNFSSEFIDWLPENEHVWEAFTDEVFKVQQKGFKHYSARTIVHVLRHHSAVSEKSSNEWKKMWKINNNHSPYLARLFDLVYPHRAGLFEYRTTQKGK